jgi:hypothetical protein
VRELSGAAGERRGGDRPTSRRVVIGTLATRGRAKSDRLTTALVELAARGLRTHCSDPESSELWLSDDQAERAQAARLCIGCPVIIECGAGSQGTR